MDESKRSEEIFRELEKLEGTREGIEKRWIAARNSPSLEAFVVKVIVKERISNLEESLPLQMQLNEKLKECDREREDYLLKWNTLRRELELLTRETIRGFVCELSKELDVLAKKFSRGVISKKYDGFKRTTMLRVRSNEEAVRELRKITSEAISKIRQMQFCTIPMIEAEAKRSLDMMHKVDFARFSEREMTEGEFYRFDFSFVNSIPQGYEGPISGLPMREPAPVQKP